MENNERPQLTADLEGNIEPKPKPTGCAEEDPA